MICSSAFRHNLIFGFKNMNIYPAMSLRLQQCSFWTNFWFPLVSLAGGLSVFFNSLKGPVPLFEYLYIWNSQIVVFQAAVLPHICSGSQRCSVLPPSVSSWVIEAIPRNSIQNFFVLVLVLRADRKTLLEFTSNIPMIQ